MALRVAMYSNQNAVWELTHRSRHVEELQDEDEVDDWTIGNHDLCQ